MVFVDFGCVGVGVWLIALNLGLSFCEFGFGCELLFECIGLVVMFWCFWGVLI